MSDYPWILVVPLLAWFACCLIRAFWCLRRQSLGPGERTVTPMDWRRRRVAP